MTNKKRSDPFLSKRIPYRLAYTIISVFIIVLAAVVVYAVVPNPGHSISAIEAPSSCTAGQVLKWGGGTSWNCVTAVNQPATCSAGQYLMWNGTNGWACSTVSGSGGIINLIGGVHQSDDCTAANGEVVGVSGGSICKFGYSMFQYSCPWGWNQYQNWSFTFSATCSGLVGLCNPSLLDPPDCTTTFHGWSNTPRETCHYQFFNSASSCRVNNTGLCSAYYAEMGCI